jgi:hypothetical protein
MDFIAHRIEQDFLLPFPFSIFWTKECFNLSFTITPSCYTIRNVPGASYGIQMKVKFVFNGILLFAGWIMVIYAYPRLPQKMSLWLNFFGQQHILANKSPLFFLYVVVQTLFFIIFFVLARKISSRITFPWKAEIIKEYVYLTMIFINLIFIHVQRSIIQVAHQSEKGVDKLYFYSLFGIILILIPYFRMREKFILGRHSGE